MFTGLIADRGTVSELARTNGSARLRIDTPLAGQLQAGDSIAVNGVCLTATHVGAEGFATHAMAETLRRCTLGALSPGEHVNLELALRVADRLGGHVVQGHIDGLGTVTEVRPEGDSRVLHIAVAEPPLMRYLVEKGSIAVDGVSLTISALCLGVGDGVNEGVNEGEDELGFEVSLIPETLSRTTLGEIAAGDLVNLEMDVLAKHVERLMEARA